MIKFLSLWKIRRIESCIDFDRYVIPVQIQLPIEVLTQSMTQLQKLGRCESRMGVVYVRNDWGFFVLPPPSFGEISVSFYRGVPESEKQRLLEIIALTPGKLLRE